MDYEDFYREIQGLEKSIKEKLTNAQRSFRNIAANSEKGDVKRLTKYIRELRGLLADLDTQTSDLENTVEGFDAKLYIESGDFARQMFDYCQRFEVDVKGTSPVFEIFPYKVKINAENQDIHFGRRRVSCLRPRSFVELIKGDLDKYMKVQFNINRFISELEVAYDLAVVVKKNTEKHPRQEYSLYLKDLYGYLTPTQKARREYNKQSYAFDIARLYTASTEYTEAGRRFDWGPSKEGTKSVRILDQYGKEHFLTTICFYSNTNELQNIWGWRDFE